MATEFPQNEPEVNPYAPRTITPPPQIPIGQGSTIYRDGKLLVMPIGATLPNRCVKSNADTDFMLKRALSWHHPAVFLAILINILAYVIIALIVRRKATIYVGLSESHRQRRWRNIVLAWCLVLLGVVSLVGGIALQNGRTDTLGVLLVAGGPMLWLSAGLVGIFGCRVVSAKKINANYIWLKGCCEAYLQQFAEVSKQ